MYITPLGPKAVVTSVPGRQVDTDFYVIIRRTSGNTAIPCVDMNTAQYVARNINKNGVSRHQISVIDMRGHSVGY